VVEPCILPGTATDITLAMDDADLTICKFTRKGLWRNLECDVPAGLPEACCEFMREQQSVVALLLEQRADSVRGTFPWETESKDVPLAEFEAVGSGLTYKQLE
jgi:hypothetical protein